MKEFACKFNVLLRNNNYLCGKLFPAPKGRARPRRTGFAPAAGSRRERAGAHPKQMKIADIELGERPLLLAPMEDVTDPSFRYMCKRFGADVVYTEFISSDGLIRDAAKSLKKLEIDDAERPVGIQLYGQDRKSVV